MTRKMRTIWYQNNWPNMQQILDCTTHHCKIHTIILLSINQNQVSWWHSRQSVEWNQAVWYKWTLNNVLTSLWETVLPAFHLSQLPAPTYQTDPKLWKVTTSAGWSFYQLQQTYHTDSPSPAVIHQDTGCVLIFLAGNSFTFVNCL